MFIWHNCEQQIMLFAFCCQVQIAITFCCYWLIILSLQRYNFSFSENILGFTDSALTNSEAVHLSSGQYLHSGLFFSNYIDLHRPLCSSCDTILMKNVSLTVIRVFLYCVDTFLLGETHSRVMIFFSYILHRFFHRQNIVLVCVFHHISCR